RPSRRTDGSGARSRAGAGSRPRARRSRRTRAALRRRAGRSSGRGREGRARGEVRTAFCSNVLCARRRSPLFLVTSPMRERSLCRTGDASVHGRTRRGPRRYRAVSVEFLRKQEQAGRQRAPRRTNPFDSPSTFTSGGAEGLTKFRQECAGGNLGRRLVAFQVLAAIHQIVFLGTRGETDERAHE